MDCTQEERCADAGYVLALTEVLEEGCPYFLAEAGSDLGAAILVEGQPLGLLKGKLVLAEPRSVQVTRQIDGLGFADEAQPGDHISIHWQWACEVLRPSALRRLRHMDRRCRTLANQTL